LLSNLILQIALVAMLLSKIGDIALGWAFLLKTSKPIKIAFIVDKSTKMW